MEEDMVKVFSHIRIRMFILDGGHLEKSKGKALMCMRTVE